MRNEGVWRPNCKKSISKTTPSLNLNDYRFSLKGEGLRDIIKVWDKIGL
jgi:hypothetical protein